MESSLADHGVRKYDYETGRFISCDALWGNYLGWSPYQYGLNNPIAFVDFNGLDAIYIAFPNYTVHSSGIGLPSLGHAGVLTIDNLTGRCNYYAFGRYESNRGNVINSGKDFPSLPNVQFSHDGKPTQESLSLVLNNISQKDGSNTNPTCLYIYTGDTEKMLEYAESYDEEYNIITNNCSDFALDVIRQDDKVESQIPWSISLCLTPVGKVSSLSTVFPSFSYDVLTGKFGQVSPTCNVNAIPFY